METENQTTGTTDLSAPVTATNADASTATNVAAPAAKKPAAKKSTKQSGKSAAKPTTDSNVDETVAAGKAEPNPQAVEIWPLRSYQDAGEVKRRGGPSYTAPKRHADALIARGLASAEKPQNTK